MIKRFNFKKHRLVVAGSIIIVVIGGALLWLNIRKSASTSSTTVNPTSSQSSSQSSSKKKEPTTAPSTQQKQNSPSTTASASSLTAPQGQASHTVVSKSANEQAENSPNLEVNCLTSAGNNCIVRLTSPTGQISTINNTYSDNQGNFIFDWSAKAYAIGKWKLELVASRDGQEAATNIGPLEVTP